MDVWRWLSFDTDAIAPEKNMALDAAILESFIEGGSGQSIRVYHWSKPMVTYGRLQNREDVQLAYPTMPLIRRPTGGLAVEHGEDLVVTVVADEAKVSKMSDNKGVLSSYHTILSGILGALAEYGVIAHTGLNRIEAKTSNCFASLGKCDVVETETQRKIVGCAQLRTKGAILQQMSIRPHARYHIETREFVQTLKRHFSIRLHVKEWDDTTGISVAELTRANLS